MSGPRAREEGVEEAAAGAAEPGTHETPTLLDVAWIVAKNGYAADVWRCCGTCREMWRWIAPELSEEDAARVRRDHPFWQAIINLSHGDRGETRLIMAAACGNLPRTKTLIAWHAGPCTVLGYTALILASANGHVEVVRALLASGASKRLVNYNGYTAYNLAVITPASTAAIRALLNLAP